MTATATGSVHPSLGYVLSSPPLQRLPLEYPPHPSRGCGYPRHSVPGPAACALVLPRPAPQLLSTSPLSFLFPIIFLEIFLLAALLPGQLASLPLSRAGGGCYPGARRGTGAGEGVLQSCSRPSPQDPAGSLSIWCGFLPPAQLPLFLTAPILTAPAQGSLWSCWGFAVLTSHLPSRLWEGGLTYFCVLQTHGWRRGGSP